MTARERVVELLMPVSGGVDQLVDVSNDVREAGDITITRGRPDERSQVSYGRASLAINNRNGTYSNRNATSAYYGLIGRNTQVRIADQMHWTAGSYMDGSDAFGRTTSSGWGTADAGGAWTTSLGSGSVAASDWSTGSGVGSIGLAVANATRRSKLGSISGEDCDVYVTVKAPQATGAALEAGVVLRESSAVGGYVICKAVLNTDNSVTATIVDRAQTGTSSVTVSGLTHTGTGQPLRIRAKCAGLYLMMKVWVASAAEPSSWHVTLLDTSDTSGPAVGSPGVYCAALTGNTNVKPVTAQFDDLLIYPEIPRLWGEVASWPQEWDTPGRDVYVPLEVTGIVRRLNQGARALRSPMRRLVESVAAANAVGGLRQYWPCEDTSGATQAASGIGGVPLKVFSSNDTFPTFGSGGAAGSDGCMKFVAGNGVRGALNGFATATAFTACVCVNIPTAPGGDTQIINLEMAGADSLHRYWVFTVFPTGGVDNIGLQIFNADGTSSSTLNTIPFTIAGLDERYNRDLVIWVSGRQNGANVEYEWSVEDYEIGAIGTTGGLWTGTLGYGVNLQIPSDQVRTDWEYSHIAYWDAALDSVWGQLDFPALGYASTGYAGETAAVRFERLCTEEDVPYVALSATELTDTAAMGVQGTDKLLTLLEECATADQGVLTEVRQSLGLRLRTNSSLVNQTPITVTYASLHGEPPEPVEDDQGIHNDVTATRSGGSSFRAVQETGALSVLDPPLGVGVYDRGAVTVNVETDDQLLAVAGWVRHLGTWDEPRWRAVQVELAHATWVANPSLSGQVLALDTGDLLQITGTPAWVPPGPTTVMVQGYRDTLTRKTRRVSFDTTPGDPWTVAEFDSATTAKFDTSGCYVKTAVSSSATSLDVYTYNGDQEANDTALWTEVDAEDGFYWNIAGEKIRVDDLTHTNWAFRSVGAAASGNNASVAPAAPAGRAVGDLLLMPASIRSTSATVTEPAGYFTLFNGGNFKIFGRRATNTATDLPTVAFSGGAAGDDTFARIVAFSGLFTNVEFIKVGETNSTNGSAQNINYAGTMPRWDNCLVIVAGEKQDDWTNVATAIGTEAFENPLTAGNDMGVVMDYQIQTTRALVDGGAFVVTGGAAAVSKSCVLVLRSDTQTATVSRSQNGVVKAIAADAGVSLWTPWRFAR